MKEREEHIKYYKEYRKIHKEELKKKRDEKRALMGKQEKEKSKEYLKKWVNENRDKVNSYMNLYYYKQVFKNLKLCDCLFFKKEKELYLVETLLDSEIILSNKKGAKIKINFDFYLKNRKNIKILKGENNE